MPALQHFSVNLDFPIYCAVFSPSGELIVGGGGGASRSGVKNKLVVYDVDFNANDLKKLAEREMDEGEDAIMCLDAHPEENLIACGVNSVQSKIKAGKNENCRVYEYSNESIRPVKKVQTMSSKNTDYYQKVARFSPDGKLLATGGTDCKFTVLKYPELVPAFPPVSYDDQEIIDIDFSPSGEEVIGMSPKSLRVWSTKDGQSVETIDRPTFQKQTVAQFRACRYGKENSQVVLYTVVNVARTKAYIVKWNAETWSKVTSRVVSRKPIIAFALSDDGKLAAYGSSDLSIGICDTKTLKVLITLPNVHDFSLTTLCFDHMATTLVSGSADKSLHVLRVPEKLNTAGFPPLPVILAVVVLGLLAIAVQLYFMDFSVRTGKNEFSEMVRELLDGL